MKKLLSLKPWLTIPDAARHLSNLSGEEVSEADVLQFALGEHLKLSVNFVNRAQARCGRVVALQDAKRFLTPSLDGKQQLDLIEGIRISEDQVFEPHREVVTIEGVWDLTMRGAERIDVENRYQLLTEGPLVDLQSLDGPLLCIKEGTHCQLQSHFSDNEFFNQQNLKEPRNHPDNYHPAGGLPADCVLVVRTSALHELEALLSEPDPKAERPLQRRERDTLLVIIAALADLPRVDVKKPSSAAVTIESQTVLMGARVAARTIENHLKFIPEALEGRSG